MLSPSRVTRAFSIDQGKESDSHQHQHQLHPFVVVSSSSPSSSSPSLSSSYASSSPSLPPPKTQQRDNGVSSFISPSPLPSSVPLSSSSSSSSSSASSSSTFFKAKLSLIPESVAMTMTTSNTNNNNNSNISTDIPQAYYYNNYFEDHQSQTDTPNSNSNLNTNILPSPATLPLPSSSSPSSSSWSSHSSLSLLSPVVEDDDSHRKHNGNSSNHKDQGAISIPHETSKDKITDRTVSFPSPSPLPPPSDKDKSPRFRLHRSASLLPSPWLWQAAISEFVCTTIFFSCLFSLIISAERNGWDSQTSLITISVLGGLLVAAFIYQFGNSSGAYFSTSITVATFVLQKHSARTFILYFLSQLLGSIAAVLVVLVIFPISPSHISSLVITPATDDELRVIAMEIFLTFIAVYVFLNISRWHPGMGPLATGFVVSALPIIGSSVSGGSFNLARQFGPAVVSGVWDKQYLYWIGQGIGATASAMFTKHIHQHFAVMTYSDVLLKQIEGREEDDDDEEWEYEEEKGKEKNPYLRRASTKNLNPSLGRRVRKFVSKHLRSIVLLVIMGTLITLGIILGLEKI